MDDLSEVFCDFIERFIVLGLICRKSWVQSLILALIGAAIGLHLGLDIVQLLKAAHRAGRC